MNEAVNYKNKVMFQRNIEKVNVVIKMILKDSKLITL